MQSVAAEGELADELVVVGMRTDPEPHEAAVWTVDAENAVVESDSARPEPGGREVLQISVHLPDL